MDRDANVELPDKHLFVIRGGYEAPALVDKRNCVDWAHVVAVVLLDDFPGPNVPLDDFPVLCAHAKNVVVARHKFHAYSSRFGAKLRYRLARLGIPILLRIVETAG